MTGRTAGVWVGVMVLLIWSGTGCIEHRVKTEPIEVEPIHVTVDINYRVDRRLEEFFEFQKKRERQEGGSQPSDPSAEPESPPPIPGPPSKPGVGPNSGPTTPPDFFDPEAERSIE